MSKFLFLLTIHGRFSELKYGSCVARKIAEKVKELGHDVKLIVEPTPEKANEVIKAYKPDVVWWIGHGNPTTTTLEYVKVWIKAPEYNTDILDNTIACALSCLTGLYLGKYVTEKKKCVAYLGYKSEFWFTWCGVKMNCACSRNNPYGVREELWEKIVTCPHESNLYFVLGLAKGYSVKEAFRYSLNRFNYWIDYFENVKPMNEKELSVIKVIIWALKHNRDVSVLYGDESRKVVGSAEYKMSLGLPAVMLALGSLFSYIGYKKQEVKE